MKEVVRIQRKFLWNHSEEKKGIHWVSWSSICRQKQYGGLRIKDLEKFNKAFLAKWLWRFINDENAIWKGILEERYGNLSERINLKHRKGRRSMESAWWRDLMVVGDSSEINGFSNCLSFKLGKGNTITFWQGCWLGHTTFEDFFPNIFMLYPDGCVCVNLMGAWMDDMWCWEIAEGAEDISVEAVREKGELLELLAEVTPRRHVKDSVVWTLGGTGVFLVKSFYCSLLNDESLLREEENIVEETQRVWKLYVLSKVKIFGWRLLQNWLPMRDLLVESGIIQADGDSMCFSDVCRWRKLSMYSLHVLS